MSTIQVIFFTVKEAGAKIKALIQVATSSLSEKQKLHIAAPDQATLDFVSTLLWKHPKEGFVPHSTDPQSEELIIVSLIDHVPETCSHLFNLSPAPFPPFPSLKTLYELEDLSHPNKALSFQNKFNTYRKEGFTITSGHVF